MNRLTSFHPLSHNRAGLLHEPWGIQLGVPISLPTTSSCPPHPTGSHPSGTCPCLSTCLYTRGDSSTKVTSRGAALRDELVMARELTPCPADPAGCTAQLLGAVNSCRAEDSHGFGYRLHLELIYSPPASTPSLSRVF